MRVLVRHLTHRSKASDTRHDEPLQGARLRIGRGTDQEIHLTSLRVALAHAELDQGADNKIRLNSKIATGFLYNGNLVQAAVLTDGDVIDIGGHQLKVGTAPGCDLALEISDDPLARGRETEIALLQRAKLDLTAAGLRKRPWAMGAAAVIAALFLLLPLISSVVPIAGKWMRFLPLIPSDHVWSTGKVSNAHAHFGTNCNACHTLPFIPVRNSACLACHKQVPHHGEKEILKTGLFDGARCASCHHEHTGKESLVRRDEGLCVKCHGDIKAKFADATSDNVHNFGKDHPEFRPALTYYVGGKKLVHRVPLSAKQDLRESPGLEFSHKTHLKTDGIESPSRGTVKLVCADCHKVEAGGGRMQPVKFETNCHECHKLNIPGDTVREVAHGDIPGAISAIKDYYQAWALRGGYPNVFAPDVVQTRRRPGVPLTEVEQQQALGWATETAKMATAEMLAFTTCGSCHAVEPTGHGEGADAWRMKPVTIPREWLPQSHFSHDQHGTLECKHCHINVPNSDTSADVLLPGIETCRTCHGSGNAGEGKLASTCITCHKFHRAKVARIER